MVSVKIDYRLYVFFFYLFAIIFIVFFFQAEDGIRDLVRSRGLGDVYKRQGVMCSQRFDLPAEPEFVSSHSHDSTDSHPGGQALFAGCLLYTSDAADERSSVDLGGRRIIKKKKMTKKNNIRRTYIQNNIQENKD